MHLGNVPLVPRDRTRFRRSGWSARQGPRIAGDGGETWTQLRKGLPQENAYDVVYRHALHQSGPNLAFGTTTGNLYVTEDRGDSWTPVAHNLPPIYSVRFG